MSVYCLHKFFTIMPNLICSGVNKTLHVSTRGWWAMFFVPGVCGLHRPVLLAVVNTFGMTTHFFFSETTDSGVTFLQSHQNGNYLQITTNVPFICLVVHESKNFFHVFTYFLFLDSTRNRDWRQHISLCNNIAFRLCTECTSYLLLPSDRQHSYKHWVQIVLWRTNQNPFWWEQNAFTFTVSSRRFHCGSLEHNSSALFFDSSGSLMRSESSFCMI
jgi:hypothetical protein